MYTDVMDHTCQLTIYGKLFFILVVKITCVRLDSPAVECHMCYILFIRVVNGILQNLQKIGSANGGKPRIITNTCFLTSRYIVKNESTH